MIINDLESQITFKYTEKINQLQKQLKISQIDFDSLMKKYLGLKKRHAEITKQDLLKNPRKEYQTEKKDYLKTEKEDYISVTTENVQLREALAIAKQDLNKIANNYENLIVQAAKESQELQVFTFSLPPLNKAN